MSVVLDTDAVDDPVESPAAADIVERASTDRDGPLYVLAIGAATNVASALLMEPDIVDDVVVVWLGGHPYYWHSAAEFNLRRGVQSPPGRPRVAEHLRISMPELRRWVDADHPLAEYLLEIKTDWLERRGAISTVAWDVVPVAWDIERDDIWRDFFGSVNDVDARSP